MNDYIPVFHLHLGKIDFFIERESNFGISLIETYPYAPDGDVPLTIFMLGYFHIMIDSKRIYKYFYKRKRGYNPRGLEDE